MYMLGAKLEIRSNEKFYWVELESQKRFRQNRNSISEQAKLQNF